MMVVVKIMEWTFPQGKYIYRKRKGADLEYTPFMEQREEKP